MFLLIAKVVPNIPRTRKSHGFTVFFPAIEVCRLEGVGQHTPADVINLMRVSSRLCGDFDEPNHLD